MSHPSGRQPWQVLVLFGASGTGKSTAAAGIARERGITWLQVDDLRLALQYSKAMLPEHNDELYYFLDTPLFWTRPAKEVCEALIGTARAMTPAVRVVVDSHVATGAPMVIEGDGVLPSLAADPVILPSVEAGAVRFCCIASESDRELLDNMIARGRGDHLDDVERVRQQSGVNWAFNRWLVMESR